MLDKVWLEKIVTAYKAYPFPSKEIERFITWLYNQYGIVKTENRNGKS
jgi:hypothetical protein